MSPESDSSCAFIAESSSASAPSPRKTSETFLSTCKKHRYIIVSVIFFIIILIISLLYYYPGRSVPSNHQKDAIKCPAFTCPPDWIGHQGDCYKLSSEEKNWNESRNACNLHNASLAKITDEEMEFVTNLTRNHVFWIGLKGESKSWKWLDGENATLKILGKGGDCAFLNDDATASSGSCSTKHRYICKKK